MTMEAETLEIDISHPLLQELLSLRQALERIQDEAHRSTIKFQRHTLDTTVLTDRNAQLEHENVILHKELEILQSNPIQPPDNDDQLRVSELTLSLRKLNSKLTEMESSLLSRINTSLELEQTTEKFRKGMESAYELASRSRSREENERVRAEELERKIRAMAEQCAMYDATMGEYANLVRSLEGRASLASPRHSETVKSDSESTLVSQHLSPAEHLATQKDSLNRLQEEFAASSKSLAEEVSELRVSLSLAEAKAKDEERAAQDARSDQARVLVEAEKFKADDRSAAAMVERYMKFSQSQTSSLHSTLQSLRTRHASTLQTLQAQLTSAQRNLEREKKQNDKLRDILDELGGELMKEKFGRRREVVLRISGLRSAKEENSEDDRIGQLLVAHNAVQALAEELTAETSRRFELEAELAKLRPTVLSTEGSTNADQSGPTENGTSVSPPPLPPKDDTREIESGHEEPGPVSVEVIQPTSTPISNESGSQLENLPSSSLSIPGPSSPPPPLPPPASRHPLLVSLKSTASRYDALSRSFDACYSTLTSLKSEMSSTSDPSSPTTFSTIPKATLEAALDRLLEYTEDARVELEIRSGDEALLVRGYETLLALRPALASSDGDTTSADESPGPGIEEQIEAFASGDDPAVKRATEQLRRKVEDLEHDIAVMKRAVFEPDLVPPFIQSPNESTSTSNGGIAFPSSKDEHDTTGRTSWTGWLSPSRASSASNLLSSPPAGAGMKDKERQMQTFGNVMTSRSLLRRTSSTQSLRGDDALASLGLRIASQGHGSGSRVVSPGSPPAMDVRQRTISGVYMLGLGGGRKRSVSNFGPRPVPVQRVDSQGAVEERDENID